MIWQHKRRNLRVQHCCHQQDGCYWTFPQSDKCWRSHRVGVCCEGNVQLWHGVVVFTDPDAERRTGSVPNELETTSKRARCRRTTTKEASHLNATDSDTAERRTAATSLFENLSSTKGKRQKRHSSSPLPGAEPKRKRGRRATVCSRV